MKYYGKSEEVCQKIINTFRNGNLPKSVAPIFVNRSDDIPSLKWSFCNQMMKILNGTNDARTFKQWNSVGRKVVGKSFCILGPILKTIPKDEKNEETGKTETKYIKILVGFKSIPVFKIEDTEIYDQELWDKKSGIDTEEKQRLENLPLREVAEKWELDITSFNAKGGSKLGYYQHGKRIAVGVKNLTTWCHELTHAADDKLGTINKGFGQDEENEIVAEMGSAILIEILGMKHESDLGGAWEYIKNYAGDDEKKTIKKITSLINRICACVDLIINESNEIIENN